MKEDKKDKKVIGSVVKAMEIIDLLAASESEIGATEISNHLNYGVSATYHLLTTLKMCKMIEQDSSTKKYRLGLKLWKIGKLAREQNHLVTLIQPYLKKLREITGETANLTVLDNHEIIYLAQEESKKLVRMFTKTGAKAPLYCSAAGKVLLAHQPMEKQEAIIGSINFISFTQNTITSVEQLKTQLQQVKQRGYGLDEEERELGVSCIAAPVFDFDKEIIAAVSISGPTMRFDQASREKFIECIMNITKDISHHLGYEG